MTTIERSRLGDDVFIYLNLATVSDKDGSIGYTMQPDDYCDWKEHRKEMSFYLSCSRTNVEAIIREKLRRYFPEAFVTGDLLEFEQRRYRDNAIIDTFNFSDKLAIARIKQTFEVLSNGGILVAIARRRLMTDPTYQTFRREFVGLHGLWDTITGAETSNSILIVLNKVSEEQLELMWQPDSGYPSSHSLHLSILLDNDRRLDDRKHQIKRINPSIDKSEFEAKITPTVEEIVDEAGIEDGHTYYYSPKVRSQLIDVLYEQFQEEVEYERERLESEDEDNYSDYPEDEEGSYSGSCLE